jgi:hypothetical protein
VVRVVRRRRRKKRRRGLLSGIVKWEVGSGGCLWLLHMAECWWAAGWVFSEWDIQKVTWKYRMEKEIERFLRVYCLVRGFFIIAFETCFFLIFFLTLN